MGISTVNPKYTIYTLTVSFSQTNTDKSTHVAYITVQVSFGEIPYSHPTNEPGYVEYKFWIEEIH